MITMLKKIPIWGWAMALIIIPMAIQVVMKWYQVPFHDGMPIGPADPDPWLRLVLVRDWMMGGGWHNHVVVNSNAPMGAIASPWTRPLDALIAFLASLQPESVELNLRLMRAALLVPLLMIALLLIGIYRNVKILCAVPSAAFMVTALVASCLPMWNYFNSGNADHHSLLAVVFVWAMAGVLTPNPSPRLTVLSGALLALQLWISPEAMLLIGAIYGWYALLWLMGDARAKPWLLLSFTTVAGSAIALMIERAPSEWFTPIYDSISIVYVVMLMLAASVVWALRVTNPSRLAARILLSGVSVLIAAALTYNAFPLIIHGPLAGVDPYILHHFMPRIVEAQPLFSSQPLRILALLIHPMIAAWLLVIVWRRGNAIFTRTQVTQLGYFLLMTGALFLTQQRFYYYFYPILLLILAPMLGTLLTPVDRHIVGIWPARWINKFSVNGQMVRRLSLMIATFGLPVLLLVLTPLLDTAHSRSIDSCLVGARKLIYSGGLNDLGYGRPLTLFASTDLGGEILFFTPHRIIASNYHREGKGIEYIWEADMITDPLELRRYLAERKVDALLLCPVVRAPEMSVLQRLRQNTTNLDWLRPVNYNLPKSSFPSSGEEATNPMIFIVK